MSLHSQWNEELFLRPGGDQRSFICGTMYHAPILRRDIWENCFVEVTGSGSASCPQPRSPQADSMVLFGAFCNFCVQKKKKETVPKWLEWMYFCWCPWRKKRYRRASGDVSRAGKDGNVSWCVRWPSVFFLWSFFFSHFFYWAFYIIIKTFSTNIHREPIKKKEERRRQKKLLQVQWWSKAIHVYSIVFNGTGFCRPADMVLPPPPLSFQPFEF